MIDRASRYFSIPTAEHVMPDGTSVTYVRRRFLPQPSPGPHDRGAVVREGDRLDTIAARLLGDPLQFWRIADANNAMNPFDLIEPGAVLTIPCVDFGDGSS